MQVLYISEKNAPRKYRRKYVVESGRMSSGVFMIISICGARKTPRTDMSTPQTAPKAMLV